MREQRMVWVVSEFQDAVRQLSDRVACKTWIDGKTPMYKHVFDTRELATWFIRDRAHKKVQRAMEELARAKARLRKCNHKFAESSHA